jgi:nucleotide-binding universal stress UspA family protein
VSEPRVVVGAQAGAGSLAALAWALTECRERGAELVLVHALDPADAAHGHDDPAVREAAGRAELEVHRDAAARVAPDVRVSMELIELPAGEALVTASEHADLVVLGSRGRADVAASALGSVAHRTAVHARCPVAIVRAETAPSRLDHERRIVVGVADAPAGRAAVRFAADEAARKGATLHLVLCADGGNSALADAEARLVDVTTELAVLHEGLRVETAALNSEPVLALLDASREADLVVLGCHHSEDPWASRIGGVAAGVLGRAFCPVVLVGTLAGARHGPSSGLRRH